MLNHPCIPKIDPTWLSCIILLKCCSIQLLVFCWEFLYHCSTVILFNPCLGARGETCSFGSQERNPCPDMWVAGWLETQHQGLGESEPKLRQSRKLRCNQWGAAEQYSLPWLQTHRKSPACPLGWHSGWWQLRTVWVQGIFFIVLE